MLKPKLEIALRTPGQRMVPEKEARLEQIAAEIEARGNGIAGKSSQAKPTGRGTRTSPRLRLDGQAVRGTTIVFPVGLAKRLSLHCAANERKQSDVVSEAVEVYLNQR